MAVVDFSNAVLDVNTGQLPMTYGNYLDLNNDKFYNSSYGIINTNRAVSKILNTPTKVSILYTGTFVASGTEFSIASTSNMTFYVSNISYSSGDTYAFVIDIEVSGNT